MWQIKVIVTYSFHTPFTRNTTYKALNQHYFFSTLEINLALIHTEFSNNVSKM